MDGYTLTHTDLVDEAAVRPHVDGVRRVHDGGPDALCDLGRQHSLDSELLAATQQAVVWMHVCEDACVRMHASMHELRACTHGCMRVSMHVIERW